MGAQVHDCVDRLVKPSAGLPDAGMIFRQAPLRGSLRTGVAEVYHSSLENRHTHVRELGRIIHAMERWRLPGVAQPADCFPFAGPLTCGAKVCGVVAPITNVQWR
jgi:hypothetical protein